MSAANKKLTTVAAGKTTEYLTVMVAGQTFGLPVLKIQDVLARQRVTRIPLAAQEIAGSLNLRGRIVTAIDVRRRLAMPQPAEGESRMMSVVVEHNQDLYSLVFDSVGEVLAFEDADFEKNPSTLDTKWREISLGIYRLEDRLVVILDVPRLLDGIGS